MVSNLYFKRWWGEKPETFWLPVIHFAFKTPPFLGGGGWGISNLRFHINFQLCLLVSMWEKRKPKCTWHDGLGTPTSCWQVITNICISQSSILANHWALVCLIFPPNGYYMSNHPNALGCYMGPSIFFLRKRQMHREDLWTVFGAKSR